MIKNVYRSSCEVPVILIRFKWNLNILDSFSKNAQISNLMKIRPVGSEFRAERRTVRHDEAKVVCRNFVNAPNYAEKNVFQCLFVHHRSSLDQPGIKSAPSRWGSDDLETEPWARPVLRNDFCMLVEILLVKRSLMGVRLMYEKILKPVWQSWYASWRTGNRLLRCIGLLILISGGPIFL